MSRYIIIEDVHSDNPQIVMEVVGWWDKAKCFDLLAVAKKEAGEYQDSKVVKLY